MYCTKKIKKSFATNLDSEKYIIVLVHFQICWKFAANLHANLHPEGPLQYKAPQTAFVRQLFKCVGRISKGRFFVSAHTSKIVLRLNWLAQYICTSMYCVSQFKRNMRPSLLRVRHKDSQTALVWQLLILSTCVHCAGAFWRVGSLLAHIPQKYCCV